MSESAVMALTRNIKGSQLNASCSDFIIIIRLSMTLQRGNAVSVHNTMVTEKIAVATIILYVEPSFPACGFVLVGLKIIIIIIIMGRCPLDVAPIFFVTLGL